MIRILLMMLLMATHSVTAFAQHRDIELGYDDVSNPTTILIDSDAFTLDGFLYFESEMELLDPFDPTDFGSDEPGFATNPNEGLLVNSGDQIWLKAVDAVQYSNSGVGFVNYYNPSTDQLEPTGRIAVIGNSISVADLVLNGASIESGGNPQFVDVGNSNNIHDHVIFDLVDDETAPFGAYGIMFQLESDLAPADGEMDVESEPFWIIWNHGMSEADFESLAIPQFMGAGGVVTVAAESFDVTRGTHVSGGLAELAESDNVDLVARRNSSDISSRVFLELKASTLNQTPTRFNFLLEGSVFARSTVVQSIDLYDYATGVWEEVDSRDATRFTDSEITAMPGGDLTRFIEPGTGCIEARIRYQSINPRQQFTANIDQAIWLIE